jgi:hypothetical protein
MSATIVLLAIIAVTEILRLVLTHLPTSKKAHFKQKLEGVQKMVWDLEFKKFKTREVRESIRQEYDFMLARADSFKKQIAEWPKDKDEGERKRLEDQLVLVERDAERLLAQIKSLDIEIEGAKKSNEYPDGVTGIVQNVDSLVELQGMLRDWIRKL